MVKGHGITQRFHNLLMVTFVLHDYGVEVVGVFEVPHGAEGHVHVLVQILVIVIDDVLEHAHHLIGNAVHADALAGGILPGEQLLFDVGADEGHACVGKVIRLAECAAFLQFHAAHACVVGINATHSVAAAADAIGNRALFEGLGRNPLEERHFSADIIEIIDREAHFTSCLGTARLQ